MNPTDRTSAKSLKTSERIATIGGASADAIGHKANGEVKTETALQYSVSIDQVQHFIADWPDAPRRGAEQMLQQYGPPNEATPTQLFWYGKGQWKRIIVTRDVIVHNFPAPHSDYLTQWVDMRYR